jgi:hypothetical protein
MSWLTETADTESKTSDDKWLKFPENDVVGKSTEVRFRILESEPEDTWRHWVENRLFNCMGMDTCPVCKVRNAALKINKEKAQADYRTDHRFFFNVLHEGKVKVFSFGPGLSRQLKVLSEKYGDLRDYDITVIKRKTGKLTMNVEYTAIPELPAKELSEDEQYATENRYDLSQITAPANKEDLLMVARGEVPSKPQEAESGDGPKVGNRKATKADVLMLKALVEAKGFELSHFGIVDGDELDKSIVDQLIEDLKKSK